VSDDDLAVDVRAVVPESDEGLLLIGSPQAHLVGAWFPLGREGLRVGRVKESDLVLHEGSIGRRHCAILRKGGGWLIWHLGSTNAIQVDGVAINGSELPLRGGERIQMGPFEFVFLAGGEAARQRADWLARI
jgi:pSer/pThr/pTyr-binding forkhead associated (FHA) protein